MLHREPIYAFNIKTTNIKNAFIKIQYQVYFEGFVQQH